MKVTYRFTVDFNRENVTEEQARLVIDRVNLTQDFIDRVEQACDSVYIDPEDVNFRMKRKLKG